MRQLVYVYTMFISNNRTFFHLWWKENLVKHKKSQSIMEIIVGFIFKNGNQDSK